MMILCHLLVCGDIIYVLFTQGAASTATKIARQIGSIRQFSCWCDHNLQRFDPNWTAYIGFCSGAQLGLGFI